MLAVACTECLHSCFIYSLLQCNVLFFLQFSLNFADRFMYSVLISWHFFLALYIYVLKTPWFDKNLWLSLGQHAFFCFLMLLLYLLLLCVLVFLFQLSTLFLLLLLHFELVFMHFSLLRWCVHCTQKIACTFMRMCCCYCYIATSSLGSCFAIQNVCCVCERTGARSNMRIPHVPARLKRNR